MPLETLLKRVSRTLLRVWTWCAVLVQSAVQRFQAKYTKPTSQALVIHEKFRWQLREKPTRPARAQLPDDLVPLIMDYLNAPELCTASCVNTLWFFNSYADRRWARLCIHDFHVEPTSVSGYNSKRIGARTLYKSIIECHGSLFGRGMSPSELPRIS
eukprot:CAMPEP_0171556170 /NCGR_PEP_ID=MMETSP0960-20121227/10560_1 /TAXON_ID=87120 /ORGANISM="Aurantiochytrium limacinum, Strain ATCCMYA-1381" /LENGTH=156 /DNA_ID=CAMNT_0012106365 /DNA_START=322 /DNA_END=788 /DNA_ORIENTATION=-